MSIVAENFARLFSTHLSACLYVCVAAAMAK